MNWVCEIWSGLTSATQSDDRGIRMQRCEEFEKRAANVLQSWHWIRGPHVTCTLEVDRCFKTRWCLAPTPGIPIWPTRWQPECQPLEVLPMNLAFNQVWNHFPGYLPHCGLRKGALGFRRHYSGLVITRAQWHLTSKFIFFPTCSGISSNTCWTPSGLHGALTHNMALVPMSTMKWRRASPRIVMLQIRKFRHF